MNTARIKGHLFGGGMALVTIVLLFSGFLNIESFRTTYLTSLIGSYSVSGGEVRRQIEYAVKYGKSLENFAHITALLSQIPRDTPAIENVRIMRPDGQVLYDLQGPVSGVWAPDPLRVRADFRSGQATDAIRWALHEGMYHAFLPIRDRAGAWIGTLDLQFSSATVDDRTTAYLYASAGYMVAIGIGALLLLALLLAKVRVIDLDWRIQHLKFSVLLILVLILAQLAYAGLNIRMFQQAYPAIVQENSLATANLIRKTIEEVIAKGVRYSDFVAIESWLGRIIESSPEIGRIDILVNTDDARYSTDPAASRTAPPESLWLRLSMQADASGATATLGMSLSASHLTGKVLDLALDAATILIAAFFFMGEMVVFLGLMLKKRLAKERSRQTGKPVAMEDEEDLVRPLAFLLLLSGYLSVSFIPLMMRELYEPLFGLSPTVVLALPISAEMFGAFVSSLFIGHWIDARGWRPAFLGGLAIFGLATAFSGAATSALEFIVARAGVGLGYGAAWMGLRGLVAAGTSGTAQTKGFTVLNAGIFAGQNCGAVLGAMLAERLGFSTVFYIAAALVVGTAGFTLVTVRNHHLQRTQEPGAWHRRARNFFGDPSLLAFLFLVTIPSAAVGMFLNYFVPLYAHSLGISQGNIGRTFLLYGICIIYAGPWLVRLLSRRFAPRAMMAMGGFLGVLSLTIFSVQPSFTTVIMAVIILGLAESVGLVSQNTYFLNLPAALAYGRGKALSIFSAIKKGGQMLGPAAFGAATMLGAATGVGLVAAAYFAATASFVALGRKQGAGHAHPATGRPQP